MTLKAARPGPNNNILDVPGLKVGQAEDPHVKTGVSVILADAPAICAGDVRGGGPGTRETDLLAPSSLVERADAIVLSGGSSFGLAAADGVADYLKSQNRGFQLIDVPGVPASPIVPAAILYDLANGGDKDWGKTSPYADLGRKACNALDQPLRLGKAGAGFGARAGGEEGGIGSASYVTEEGFHIGALVAVNSFGSTRLPGETAFWAWPFEENGEFGGARPSPDWAGAHDFPADTKLGAGAARANTTIGVIAVNAALTQAQAERLSVMAQDGLARAIRPVHAPVDGDAIFALATDGPPCDDPLTLTRLGLLAADCLARAVARAVYEAQKSI